MTKALITGITGQDGSYLAELLLRKGYTVHGIMRRSSSFTTGRIEHIYPKLHLHYGDLADGTGLRRVLESCQPDEVYNLAAQSHVRVSFDQAEYTADVDAVGVLRLLEAVRDMKAPIRFYQASSSEMYGSSCAPQNEETPFRPRSPYGVSKLAAHWYCRNYRESYGMFVACGILFNHECIAASTPLMLRHDGIIEVTTPEEMLPLRQKGRNVQTFEAPGLEVWDGAKWTAVLGITATKRRQDDADHALLSIEARAGIVEATAHHHMLDASTDALRADAVGEGTRLLLTEQFPPASGVATVSVELAEFLGLMAADGYVSPDHKAQFTKNDPALRERVATLWQRLFLGAARHWQSSSGFEPDNSVWQLALTGVPSICDWLRDQLYMSNGLKRVPPVILNASVQAQRAFLEGHYAGDGLKAGNGDSVKTNSAVLAQGLCWLYANMGRQASVYVEHRDGRNYYQLNIFSDAPGAKGQHLRKDPAEVRRVAPAAPSEWVFDLETESRRFCAGVGRLVVHNSPRRGETFVTRKITRAVTRYALGLQDELVLGNQLARRDWGFAGDYVEAMWRMLQADAPDDFVIATGRSHTVREFLVQAVKCVHDSEHAGPAALPVRDGRGPILPITHDARYDRPTEVDHLQGDASKAKRVLGWTPIYSFRDLVELMVREDMVLAKKEKLLKDHGHAPG